MGNTHNPTRKRDKVTTLHWIALIYIFYTALVVFVVISQNPDETRGWVWVSIAPLVFIVGLIAWLLELLSWIFYKK